MHGDTNAVMCQQQSGQDEVWELLVPVRIGRPVEIYRNAIANAQVSTRGLYEADKLGRGFLAVAQNGKKGAELDRLDLAGEDLCHGGLGLRFRQRSRQRLATRHGADECRESMGCGWILHGTIKSNFALLCSPFASWHTGLMQRSCAISRRCLVWAMLALLGAALWIEPADAHRIGVSSVTLFANDQAVEGEVVVKGSDLETLLGVVLVDTAQDIVLVDALEANADAVVAALLRHVIMLRGDGVPCNAGPEPPEADQDGVLFWVIWDCGTDADPIVYRNTLFHDANPLAIQNILLYRGETQIQDVLTSKYTDLAVTAVPPPGLWQVFLRYVYSGISHISVGYDHIAFLIALLLWARRAWPMVKVVTAFTVAHSITLALAVLDIVNLPSAIVEPLIAASIIWVAAENLLGQRIEGRWRITFTLGLVHGFGFAGVLREFGLPSDALGVALAGFNIGVEIGQVTIVALTVPTLLVIDRLLNAGERSPALVRVASLLIVGLGLYWLVRRTILV